MTETSFEQDNFNDLSRLIDAVNQVDDQVPEELKCHSPCNRNGNCDGGTSSVSSTDSSASDSTSWASSSVSPDSQHLPSAKWLMRMVTLQQHQRQYPDSLIRKPLAPSRQIFPSSSTLLASPKEASSLNKLMNQQAKDVCISRQENAETSMNTKFLSMTSPAIDQIACQTRDSLVTAKQSEHLDSPYICATAPKNNRIEFTEDQPRPKATRQRISPQQTAVLQVLFDSGLHFPSREVRDRLSKQLFMSSRTIQVWFQNKRQSTRNRHKEASKLLCEKTSNKEKSLAIRWMKPVTFSTENHQAVCLNKLNGNIPNQSDVLLRKSDHNIPN